jgi:hypothetical protein
MQVFNSIVILLIAFIISTISCVHVSFIGSQPENKCQNFIIHLIDEKLSYENAIAKCASQSIVGLNLRLIDQSPFDIAYLNAIHDKTLVFPILFWIKSSKIFTFTFTFTFNFNFNF